MMGFNHARQHPGRAAATRAGLLAVALLAAGCASQPLADQRVAPYAPRISPAERLTGQEPVKRPEVVAMPPAVPKDVPENATTNAPAITPAVAAGGTTEPAPEVGRILRRGDRVIVYLRGIPRPEDITDIIDGEGNINLPHVGTVAVEGLTTSSAERLIEKRYVDGGIYSRINVILVAEEVSYFVRGEVSRPGKYPLTGETTLPMAISAAGGYTDFANPRKVRVTRADEVFTLNASRMESRRDENFYIEPNDIIVVRKKWFW